MYLVKKPWRAWPLGVPGGVPVVRVPEQCPIFKAFIKKPVYHQSISLRSSVLPAAENSALRSAKRDQEMACFVSTCRFSATPASVHPRHNAYINRGLKYCSDVTGDQEQRAEPQFFFV